MSDEEKRRVFKVMDEMAEDIEKYAIEVVRARGHPDENDPLGRMAYETAASLILMIAAKNAATKSGEREWLRSVIAMSLSTI